MSDLSRTFCRHVKQFSNERAPRSILDQIRELRNEPAK